MNPTASWPSPLRMDAVCVWREGIDNSMGGGVCELTSSKIESRVHIDSKHHVVG